MTKQNGLLQLLFLFALVGGSIFYVPHSTGRAAAVSPPSASRPARSDPTTVALGEQPSGAGVPNALSLTADFLNVDVSPPALEQQARAALATIGSLARGGRAPTLRDLRHAQFLHDLLHLPFRPDSGLEPARQAASRLRNHIERLVPQDCNAAAQVIATIDPVQAAALASDLEVARAFLVQQLGETLSYNWPSPDALELGVVARAAHDEGVRPEFLLATVPDWIDSGAAFIFDSALDAIQRAAGDSRFWLDRFYFPDWRPGKTPDPTAPRILHEQWPGVVLFRATDTGGRVRLLTVLFVGETPTAGIHQQAFVRAMRTIQQWAGAAALDRCGETEPRQVRILGPYFSGSSASLARALGNLPADAVSGTTFRIVSGSASTLANQATLQSAFDHRTFESSNRPAISFHATSLPEDELRGVLDGYFRSAASGLAGRKVALLAESNTYFGRRAAEGELFSDPVQFYFPLYISRVRRNLTPSEGESPAGASIGQLHRPLSLEDTGAPMDQLPAMTPAMTAPSAELVLANIFRTINRENISIVGLLATDARDKLFLASELRRNCPQAMLFTLRADLLYAHPDFAESTRGMIIASTYPLFNETQRWSTGNTVARAQFATASIHGVYNAALALINYGNDPISAGLFTSKGHPRPPLLDYSSPWRSDCPGDGCHPPVWLGVVGRGGIWPLGAFTAIDA